MDWVIVMLAEGWAYGLAAAARRAGGAADRLDRRGGGRAMVQGRLLGGSSSGSGVYHTGRRIGMMFLRSFGREGRGAVKGEATALTKQLN
jgi:hypothetical protein